MIKEKLKIANNKGKVKLLTITSVSWSIQPIANFFPCINSNGEGSKKLNKKKLYILSVQKEKTGRPISDELKQAL